MKILKESTTSFSKSKYNKNLLIENFFYHKLVWEYKKFQKPILKSFERFCKTLQEIQRIKM